MKNVEQCQTEATKLVLQLGTLAYQSMVLQAKVEAAELPSLTIITSVSVTL